MIGLEGVGEASTENATEGSKDLGCEIILKENMMKVMTALEANGVNGGISAVGTYYGGAPVPGYKHQSSDPYTPKKIVPAPQVPEKTFDKYIGDPAGNLFGAPGYVAARLAKLVIYGKL